MFSFWRGFTPVIGNEKRVEFVAATERDVTDRKRATEELRKSEEKLLALNDELERRVERRTRELLETQAKYLHVEKLSAIGKMPPLLRMNSITPFRR